jgi:hypothetical protein
LPPDPEAKSRIVVLQLCQCQSRQHLRASSCSRSSARRVLPERLLELRRNTQGVCVYVNVLGCAFRVEFESFDAPPTARGTTEHGADEGDGGCRVGYQRLKVTFERKVSHASDRWSGRPVRSAMPGSSGSPPVPVYRARISPTSGGALPRDAIAPVVVSRAIECCARTRSEPARLGGASLAARLCCWRLGVLRASPPTARSQSWGLCCPSTSTPGRRGRARRDERVASRVRLRA